MEQVQLTDNEKALLKAIITSEYNDGTGLASVWVDCLWGFEGKKKFGGVMASLAKKHLAWTDGKGCAVTQKGLDFAIEEKLVTLGLDGRIRERAI